ncbi:MAG: succinate dehydrogenase, cytochrome b556 subunit [Burkholderiales bacterium RIFCSPLOWO2_12_FULL_61_40]|nr:MAG: succinate dehydrogenase, cytochrome b556 subunit [Burkholderiales bacterium RIFCSPLOWO2_12_FULL_61_40]
MSALTPPSKVKRPEFRNINAFADLPGYRWPLAALVSGMHRASGLMMFLLLPCIIWMFDTSLSSEISFARFTSVFTLGVGFIPGILVKLVTLALIWAYLHHFIAGMRHIRMDIFHTTSKEQGFKSARMVMVLSLGLTAVLGAKLFGWY